MQTNKDKEISWGDVDRKLFLFFGSMQFSLILLSILLAACVAGSILPQEGSSGSYIEQYGAGLGSLILKLQLHRVFTAWWFVLTAGLLCLNLLLCSILRFPRILKRWRTGFDAEACVEGSCTFSLPLPEGIAPSQPGLLGKKTTSVVSKNGTDYIWCVKNRAGIWGSWLCHLGMLLVIVGFAAGRAFSKEYVVYGIPGSVQPVADTGLCLSIDDFTVDMREDYTVEQYTAALTLLDAQGNLIESGTASVNHPMSAAGFQLYQDSTGWANYVDITENGVPVKTDLICVGEYTYPDSLSALNLMLNKFYPDLIPTPEGGFTSATPVCSNPHSLYSLYYGGTLMAMNLVEMGTPIEVSNYTFTFHDPVQYTLIVLKKDPTAPMVALASLIMLLGILLAFYCRPYMLWSDGQTLYARSDKAPGLLKQQLSQTIKRQNRK